MIELVEYIVKQLVSKPDEVKVEEQNAEGMTVLLLSVAPDDMGLVIGKAGQTIKAIRRILTIRAMADGVRVNLELKETGDGPKRSEETSEVDETGESEDQKASEPEDEVEDKKEDEKSADPEESAEKVEEVPQEEQAEPDKKE